MGHVPLRQMMHTINLTVSLVATGFKKGDSRGQTMSRNTYDAQQTGKGCKMSAHHVPLRQMIHTRRHIQGHREKSCKNTSK